jgi:predicted DNA-binding protein (UPF0278 family)
MASIEEELRLDAEEDVREAEYILAQLSSELKERFTRDDVIALVNTTVEYYFDSGILDGDDDVDIDLEETAAAVCKKAKENGLGDYDPADVFFIVQADLDYQEQNL